MGWVWSPHLSRSSLLFCHALWGLRLLDFLCFLTAAYMSKHLEFTDYNCAACSLLLQQQKMVLDSHTLETLVFSK